MYIAISTHFEDSIEGYFRLITLVVNMNNCTDPLNKNKTELEKIGYNYWATSVKTALSKIDVNNLTCAVFLGVNYVMK